MGLPAFQTALPSYVSPEDYLRLEREAEFKHEYFDGVIEAMAGVGFAHNRIRMNISVSCIECCAAKAARPWAATSGCRF